MNNKLNVQISFKYFSWEATFFFFFWNWEATLGMRKNTKQAFDQVISYSEMKYYLQRAILC